MSAPPDLTGPPQPLPSDLEALFDTSEYFDLSPTSPMIQSGSANMTTVGQNLGETSATHERQENCMPSQALGKGELADVLEGTRFRV